MTFLANTAVLSQIAVKELLDMTSDETEKSLFRQTHKDALKVWLQVPVSLPGVGGGDDPEVSVQRSSVSQEGSSKDSDTFSYKIQRRV